MSPSAERRAQAVVAPRGYETGDEHDIYWHIPDGFRLPSM